LLARFPDLLRSGLVEQPIHLGVEAVEVGIGGQLPHRHLKLEVTVPFLKEGCNVVGKVALMLKAMERMAAAAAINRISNGLFLLDT
jgi:hypothetical protein